MSSWNRGGQVLIEHLLVLFLFLLPLAFGAGRWVALEYQRSRCALFAFQEARKDLIRTDARIDRREPCPGGGTERVTLRPLRDLDRGPDGLDLSDLIKEASSLWEELSFFWSPSQESDSGSP